MLCGANEARCANCHTQVNSLQQKVDSSVLNMIRRNNDIIVQCIFSIANIDHGAKKQILDINSLDSLSRILSTESLIYNEICKNKSYNEDEYVHLITKWCYCYRLFESVFVFTNKSENPKYLFENIINDIPELQPILKKYVPINQTVDALSFSQSEMLFLDCLNYATQLNGVRTNSFFIEYFKAATLDAR